MNRSSQSIQILVSPTGEATVQTYGFAGSSCRDASAFIERALGDKQSETLTPEFHQGLAQTEQARQRS